MCVTDPIVEGALTEPSCCQLPMMPLTVNSMVSFSFLRFGMNGKVLNQFSLMLDINQFELAVFVLYSLSQESVC